MNHIRWWMCSPDLAVSVKASPRFGVKATPPGSTASSRSSGTSPLTRPCFCAISCGAFRTSSSPTTTIATFAGDIGRDELYRNHREEFLEAKKSALKISLGPNSHAEVKRIISGKLKGQQKWALVGGPPCQAYSIVGRSRMMGDPDFEEDERHTLYLEYLKIIIDHQPPVFVMENVKGMLSARINGKPAITRSFATCHTLKPPCAMGPTGLPTSSIRSPRRSLWTKRWTHACSS